MQLKCELLTPDAVVDFKALLSCYKIAFELDDFVCPADAHLQTILADERFRVWVARADGRVIGGLTGFILPQYYVTKPQFYLYDMAVLPVFHRKGIGSELISALKHYCMDAGFDNFFVQADVEDTYALEFYRATGGVAAEVMHFTYTF